MRCAGIPAYNIQRANFYLKKKWKWWIYNIFAFLCVFDGSSIFWGVFFWKVDQILSSCQNFPTGQPASINNKNPTILTQFCCKTAACQNFPAGQPASVNNNKKAQHRSWHRSEMQYATTLEMKSKIVNCKWQSDMQKHSPESEIC